MLQFFIVNRLHALLLISFTLTSAAYGQAPAGMSKSEFDAVSIKANPPRTGFHFTTDSGSGGPGTPDPGMFRCSECTLATLIGKAFDLRDYQFPGKSSLGDSTFEVTARIPAGATREEFLAMMQNMLKDRFSLSFHYKEKTLGGYHLIIARGGSKLKESSENAKPPAADQHGQNQFGQGENHTHAGLVNFGGAARFRADHQTMADLARLLADQLGAPVDDRTGLNGQYDIALSWTGNADRSGNHADGNFGGAGHGDHAGPTGSFPGAGEPTGPGLLDAVQSQLGLKLAPSEQTTAKIFVIDHVEKLPTGN